MSLGILGGVSAIGTDSALGIIDPKGQTWNNTTYQACAGAAIQSCGSQAFEGGWPQSQLAACIDSAQSKCISLAKSAMTSVMTTGQVSTLQQKINAALAKYGYCPIDVDGQLGPTTCGASAWAVKTDPSIGVPGVCGSTIKVGSGFLVDCAIGPVTKTLTETAPPKPTYAVKPAVKPAPPMAYLPPAKPKMSTANMMMIGGAVAGVGVLGYYVAKKKGWLK